MNTFGQKFRFTTFGESHGKAIGCIVDGVPAGLAIDENFIQSEMDRRRPGKTKFETSRKEEDKVEIFSGVFEGLTTGTPIAMVIFNQNQKSSDYSNIKDLFRPGHADYTYFHKYGIRDYRGGGRSSARETAARVAAGAIAKLLIRQVRIEVRSGLLEVGGVACSNIDFEHSRVSSIFSLDASVEDAQKNAVETALKSHDSIGGVVLVKAFGVPVGLGEPMYHKLDGKIADAMMGINAVKGIEIGEGCASARSRGSVNNDQISSIGFLSNQSGGILGGISNGDEIEVKVYFKPTPSIFIEQKTVNKDNEDSTYFLKGRHDPCVAIRGSVVCESMLALVLADMILLNVTSKVENIKKIYQK